MDHTVKRNLVAGAFVALSAVLVFVLLLFWLALRPSQSTSDSVHQSGKAQNGQNASVNGSHDGSEQSSPPPTDDRILHILPGLFGDPVSDMRTYSIPLVYSYRGHIPPRTTLVLQGVIVSSFGTQGFLLADSSGQKEVLCEMSRSELEDAAYYYKRGQVVQIMGKYYDGSLLPVMHDCTMSSKKSEIVMLPGEGLPKYIAEALSTPDLAPNLDEPAERELVLGANGQRQFIPTITSDDCGASSCGWTVFDLATKQKVLQGGSGSLHKTHKITNGFYDVVVEDGTASVFHLFIYEYVRGQYKNTTCYEVPINPDGPGVRSECP